MKNPTMLYKHPGKHKIHGNMFDYKIVAADDVKAELAAGWFSTTDGALIGVPDDDAPPIREEMEAKARELGISFRSDISDAKLMQRIDEAIR